MSKPINDGGPAFPFAAVSEETGQPINGCFNPGMTLRDYFAAAALSGMLANPDVNCSNQTLTRSAYKYADAMLEQREAQP